MYKVLTVFSVVFQIRYNVHLRVQEHSRGKTGWLFPNKSFKNRSSKFNAKKMSLMILTRSDFGVFMIKYCVSCSKNLYLPAQHGWGLPPVFEGLRSEQVRVVRQRERDAAEGRGHGQRPGEGGGVGGQSKRVAQTGEARSVHAQLWRDVVKNL